MFWGWEREKRGMKDYSLQGKQRRPFIQKLESRRGGAPQDSASLNIAESLGDPRRDVKLIPSQFLNKLPIRYPLRCRSLYVMIQKN